MQSANRTGSVGKRVASCIAIGVRIRKLANPYTIENYEYGLLQWMNALVIPSTLGPWER